jgi:hypothetical protein
MKSQTNNQRLEPITTEQAPGGAIVNPAVVTSNGLARYTVGILPSGIPDSRIEWNIADGAGNVEFYNGNNKGRSVIVRGKAVGDFKLEVSVNGNAPDPKPYIKGKVLEKTVTPLHFFIACDEFGNPVLTNATEKINAWVNRANRDYTQAAMSFYVANIKYVSSNAWLHIANPLKFHEMCSYTNNTGGLEVYVVGALFDRAAGMHSDQSFALGDSRRGLAVTADAPLMTLGHEIGHACGLDDIKKQRLGNILVSENLVGPDNWSGSTGTGYYSSGLQHTNLITRLLMHGSVTETQCDIPLGHVWAYPDDPNVSNPTIRAVGVNSMRTRTPLH